MKNDKNEKMTKQEWIDRVMDSVKEMNTAIPPEYLAEKIAIEINQPGKIKAIPLPAKHWAAAAILLLALNISSVIYSIDHSRKNSKQVAMLSIADEIQTQSTYNY